MKGVWNHTNQKPSPTGYTLKDTLMKLRNENELLKAKTESIASQKKADELYAEAMKAFGTYRGFSEDSSEEDSDD